MIPTADPIGPRDKATKRSIDWSPWLAGANTTIANASTITCSDPSITVTGGVLNANSTAVAFTVAGGIAGKKYLLESQIVTADGQTVVRHVYLPVANL